MTILYATERVPAVSKEMRRMGGPEQTGVAWFELVLHGAPADDCTWEDRARPSRTATRPSPDPALDRGLTCRRRSTVLR